MSAHVLPIESWHKILRHATYSHHLLDPEWIHHPGDNLWVGWDTRTLPGTHIATQIAVSQKTKRSAMLVCRTWRELGTEFLYEAIRVPLQRDRILQLLDAIKQSSSGIEVGWWVKRLHCSVRSMDKSHAIISSLLEHCPNLQTFILTSKSWFYSTSKSYTEETLQSQCSRSLRRLDVLLDDPTFVRSTMYAELLSHISLTSLSITLRGPILNLPAHSSFESISTLTLYMPHGSFRVPLNMGTAYFPNLRTLALDNFSNDEITELALFVGKHQNTLLYLRLQPAEPECDFLLLLSQALNIRSLALPDSGFATIGRLVSRSAARLRLAAITHIGLLRNRGSGHIIPTPASMQRIIDMGIFPGLKSIYLDSKVDSLDIRLIIGPLEAALLKHGIRLEYAPRAETR